MNPPQLGQERNGLATCSLICGIGGFLTGPLTGIVAIVTGHSALKKIRLSGGALGGGNAATCGLVLGYITTVLSVFVLALAALATPQILRALDRATMAENVSNARQVKMVLDMYAMDEDGKYPPALIDLVTTGNVDSLEPIKYRDRQSKKRLDWIYFPGQENISDVSNIILASPMTVRLRGGEGRIVVYIDGSSKPIPEAEFQTQVRRQGAQIP